MSMSKKTIIHRLRSTNGRSTWTTTTRRLNGVRRSEGSHKSHGGRSTSQQLFYCMTGIHTTIVTSSSGGNSLKPMVAEWEAQVTKFTELPPHFRYDTFSWRRASHWATLHGKPWRIIVISSIETFCQQVTQGEANGSQFRSPGIFLQVILDQTDSLRMSVTLISKFRKANGRMVNMDSRKCNVHMTFHILSLEPHYEWMLTATLLETGIEDLHWI